MVENKYQRTAPGVCLGCNVTIYDFVNLYGIGHHVCFINDCFPRATLQSGELQTEANWEATASHV